MDAFETIAILEDSSHLVLRHPVPQAAGKECRVIVLFEKAHDTADADNQREDALLQLAALAEPMGVISNEEMDRAIYGV
jgi:hypothetical protein